MKKRMMFAVLVVLLSFRFHTTANAKKMAPVVTPTLSFSGTTANCSVSITEIGKPINATLQLWHGNTLIKSWSGNGTNHLIISGTCKVMRGQSYTLKASGTINGLPFTGTVITRICP